MRPRSVGTFLISRPDTSAKLSARLEDALDVVARQIVDRQQVASHGCPPRGRRLGVIVTSSSPSSSSTRTFTRSYADGGQVLAHVVGADRQLAVAAVGQHGQLHAPRAAVVEQRVDRRAHGAAGVEHVVHQDDRGAARPGSRCARRAPPAASRASACRRRRGRRRCPRRPSGTGSPTRSATSSRSAAGQHARHDGGCRRWRSPRRRSSRRSRERCAPACAARRRGRGTIFSVKRTAPSWPLGTGLKERSARASQPRRDACALVGAHVHRVRRARGTGSVPSRSRAGTIVRSNTSAGLVAQLARRRSATRRGSARASSPRPRRPARRRRARSSGPSPPRARPRPRRRWPRARAGRRRCATSARHLARRACRRRAPPCARAASRPAPARRRHPVRRSRRAGAGRSRGPGVTPSSRARASVEAPGPLVLDQRVAQRRHAVVHLVGGDPVAVAVQLVVRLQLDQPTPRRAGCRRSGRERPNSRLSPAGRTRSAGARAGAGRRS